MKKNYPLIVQQLGWIVLISTLLYAFWSGAFLQGNINLSPDILLLSHPSWSSIWQPITSAVTLPYQGIQFTMVFDLALLHMFLSPISSFVVSFLSTRHFLIFLIQIITAGTLSFFCASAYIPTPPSSLFGSVALCVILFWTLLHKKGHSSFFTIIPIKPVWALGIPTLFVLIPSILSGNWAKFCATCTMLLWTYIWAVARWKLRSNISQLQKLESFIDMLYLRMTIALYWHVFRHFQPIMKVWNKILQKFSARRA